VRGLAGAAALAVGLAALPALAKGPQVHVQAVVVFASTTPGEVDATLVPVLGALEKRVRYHTLKKVDSRHLELDEHPVRLALPNGRVAEITLVSVKDNVAQVHVKVPPLDAIYMLARARSLYIQSGPNEDGELWLIHTDPQPART
jgi:hypothetical protein